MSHRKRNATLTFCHFERSAAEPRNLAIVCPMPSKGRFLHSGPLRGPPVEMTKAQILITICIIGWQMKHRGTSHDERAVREPLRHTFSLLIILPEQCKFLFDGRAGYICDSGLDRLSCKDIHFEENEYETGIHSTRSP